MGVGWRYAPEHDTILTFRSDHTVDCRWWSGRWEEVDARTIRVKKQDGVEEVYTISDSKLTMVENTRNSRNTVPAWTRVTKDNAAH
jgi:hypothetical protein